MTVRNWKEVAGDGRGERRWKGSVSWSWSRAWRAEVETWSPLVGCRREEGAMEVSVRAGAGRRLLRKSMLAPLRGGRTWRARVCCGQSSSPGNGTHLCSSLYKIAEELEKIRKVLEGRVGGAEGAECTGSEAGAKLEGKSGKEVWKESGGEVVGESRERGEKVMADVREAQRESKEGGEEERKFVWDRVVVQMRHQDITCEQISSVAAEWLKHAKQRAQRKSEKEKKCRKEETPPLSSNSSSDNSESDELNDECSSNDEH
ncbi:uncharacterized protein [Temnothorax nylanderi]|uniref:uncharacterized protein n=1 Tax=Temnothorax nylanderi TaxID=102681 RepID=UPI003A8837E0